MTVQKILKSFYKCIDKLENLEKRKSYEEAQLEARIRDLIAQQVEASIERAKARKVAAKLKSLLEEE